MKKPGSILAAFAFLVAGQCAFGARVYFTDQPSGAAGSVMSVAPNGTDQRTVISVSSTPDLRGIAYHSGLGRIFYLDNGAAKKVYSILPDGTGQQEIVTLGGTFNADLELDEAAGKIYWAETSNGAIMRANVNGTTVESAVAPGVGDFTAPYFFFVDAVGGHVYWGVPGSGSISSSFRRATLAGVIDPDFSITSPTRTRDIAIDSVSGTAYWCDRQTGTLYRRAVSGGVNQTVIPGMNAPHGIALDVEAGKVYWADTGQRGNPPSGLSPRRVARCNFDGSEFENISTPPPATLSEPWDLALDLSSRTYAEWRTRFFSISTPNSEPGDDADGDGAVNLLEYAMGTHPRRAASVPRLVSEGTDMRYTRRRGSNLSYRVEVSTDLSTWRYNGDGGGVWVIQSPGTPLSTELESVAARGGSALAGAGRVFFRLRVTAP